MDRRLNLVAPINSLGYGVVGGNLAASLAGKCDLSVFSINEQPRLKNYSPSAPSVKLWHQWDLFHHVGSPRVGFPIFELDRFTTLEKESLRSQDMILVPSSWAKGIVESEIGHKHVRVVPFAADPVIFSPKYVQSFNRQEGPTVFLNVGKWEVRKGHDFIIKAFCAAFNKDDNVRLIMACHNPCFGSRQEEESYNEQWKRFYLNYRPDMAHKIQILDQRLESQEQVADLMNKADAGFFPSRAEGWNLDLFEMISMGKPCIATYFSAHTEYLTDENALLIDIDRTESAYDGFWFHNQGDWAELGDSQLEQTVEYMRSIHLTARETRPIFKPKALEGFSWDLTAEKVLKYVFKY
jgi:glycosyltransferase involved in cell wall biosynthesis